MAMCGGLAGARPLDGDETTLVSSLKAEIEKAAGEQYAAFTPISVRPQLVAGMNYFVKIDVGDAKFVHAWIYKPLGDKSPSIEAVEKGHTADSEITRPSK